MRYGSQSLTPVPIKWAAPLLMGLLYFAICGANGAEQQKPRQFEVLEITERHDDQDQRPRFPFNPDCPYVIQTPEERLRARDPSIPGNVLTIDRLDNAGMGNRIMALSNALRLGYCCKSKLVSVPDKNDIMAPGIFSEGSSGPQWFDFTSSPEVSEFNASSCPPAITWGGGAAFHVTKLDNAELEACIRTLPRLTGCEAAYFFPTNIRVCLSDPDHTHDGGDGIHQNAIKGSLNAVSSAIEYENEGEGPELKWGKEETRNNLVIHVRSGRIFSTAPHHLYGQPPLQYYLRAIEHQKWDRIDVVTSTQGDGLLNPIVPALEQLVAEKEVPMIHFHTNRTMAEDFLSTICVDGGLVTSNSSLRMTMACHTSARRVYLPEGCEKEKLESFELAKPGAEMYGITSWNGSQYSPYVYWWNTEDQWNEILNFQVAGFEKCI